MGPREAGERDRDAVSKKASPPEWLPWGRVENQKSGKWPALGPPRKLEAPHAGGHRGAAAAARGSGQDCEAGWEGARPGLAFLCPPASPASPRPSRWHRNRRRAAAGGAPPLPGRSPGTQPHTFRACVHNRLPGYSGTSGSDHRSSFTQDKTLSVPPPPTPQNPTKGSAGCPCRRPGDSPAPELPTDPHFVGLPSPLEARGTHSLHVSSLQGTGSLQGAAPAR